MSKITLLRLLVLSTFIAYFQFSIGQTNPTAQALPYTQDFSGLDATSTTYPAGWQGFYNCTSGCFPPTSFNTNAPLGDQSLIASSNAQNTTGGVHNYNGKIGFLNAGTFLGGICLAINTSGLTNIVMSFDAMVMRNLYDGLTYTRFNELGLQYRVGTTGTFTNIPLSDYISNTTKQNTAVTSPVNLKSIIITLPVACENQANVQLRWTARDLGGSGTPIGFAIDNINITSGAISTTNYYSKSTGTLENLSTWGTNTDGSGTEPANFSSDAQVFNIRNNSTPTIGAAWTVSGRASKVVVGNGTVATNFTIPSAYSYNGNIDVSNFATLTIQNSVIPGINNVGSSSTVVYDLNNSTAALYDRTYGNLTISGNSIKILAPNIGRSLNGNLTINNNSTLNFGSSGQVLTLLGNLLVDAGSTINCVTSWNRITASGSNRSFTLNGTARVSACESQNSPATLPFSYQYNSFSNYAFGSNSWVSFRSPYAIVVTQGVDGIAGTPYANVELASGTNLTTAGTNIYTFKNDVEITGNLAFPRASGTTNTSMLVNFGANTVKVGGAIQLNGFTTDAIAGGRTFNMGTGTIELNGTSAQTTLGGTDLPSTFNNLVINNINGVNLNAPITVNNNLTLTNGILNLGSNNLTVSSTSNTISGSSSSYIVTNGTGKLIKSAAAAQMVNIPVGASASSYDPAALTPTTETTFSVSVGTTLPGTISTNRTLNNKAWEISSTNPSSTLIELNPSTTATTINKDFIGRWNGSDYELVEATRSNGGSYSATFTNFSTFVTGTAESLTALKLNNNNELMIVSAKNQVKINHLVEGSVVSILNLNGQIIKREIAQNNNLTINLNNGIYLVLVQNNAKSIVSKLIID